MVVKAAATKPTIVMNSISFSSALFVSGFYLDLADSLREIS